MDPKTNVIPALGRPLHPGTLYDCRSDTFIPGMTLWDKESLHGSVASRRQPKTDLKFEASDTVSDKSKLLDVNASLKASILGGLVDVAGSARYLNDNKSSAQQSRVSLQYNQTTKFEKLTMSQLRNITYPKVFEDGTATHVVMAVLYGAQAFMVFDLTASENEDMEEIEGNLNVMVRKIPSFSVEGGGALKMTDKEKKMSDNIRCTFYGDYELDLNPTTYTEALQVYKTLPSLLRERENDAVPMKVWLYPLALLDKRAAILEREIHKTLISKTEDILDELQNAEILCNDLITNTKISDFQDVTQRLKKFKDMLIDYKVMFVKAMRKLIPAIRGGNEKEQALADIVTIHQKSPFRTEKLNQWLENNQSEQHLLTLYTQQVSGVAVVKRSTLFGNILIDPSIANVVCFCFTSLKNEDPYLPTLCKFLQAKEFQNLSTVPESDVQDSLFWFQNHEVIENLKYNHSLFRSFYQANKDDTQTRFVIVSVSDPDNPGSSIRLYRKGKVVENTFQPVSKPPAPKLDIQNRNLILKLQRSPTGSTIRFRVEYRVIQDTNSENDDEKWEATETPDAQEDFTLTGFDLTSQYQVRYRAISEVGVSEASDSSLYSPRGKFKYSVGQQWNWTFLSLLNGLRTQMFGNLVTSLLNPSTIQSEVKNLVHSPKIPYFGAITGGLKPGKALYLQGVVLETGEEIVYNLKVGPNARDDIALQLLLKPNYTLGCYTRVNGKWLDNQFYHGCPISKSQTFVIIVVIKKEGFEVFLNGRRYCKLKYRIPLERVTTLNIEGDVIINTLGVIPDWSASAYSKALCTGVSQWELSNIQSAIKYPVCKPEQPYLGPVPGGLNTGMALFFQGVLPLGSKGFQINQKTGPQKDDDILLHFKTDLNSVVCDSNISGKWQQEQSTEDNIFFEGEAFDIFMFYTLATCDIIVNGRLLLEVRRHVPVNKVSTLQISGDVFMNTFAIVHGDVNMKIEVSSLIPLTKD